MSNLKCDECGTLTVERCPECHETALCAKCRGEFGCCESCDPEAHDDNDEDEGDDEEEE